MRCIRLRSFAFVSLCGLGLFGPLRGEAAVTLVAAVNGASYVNSSLPNGKLAQGALFVGFGQGMGPASIVKAQTFPLPTNLAGTSIKVTVGGSTVDCIIFYTLNVQVAALLPSNTPAGAGTMVLTYNGESSAPLSINVTARSFGIFAINQGGSGPGVLTDPVTYAANGLTTSANANSQLDIWGTGLGAVAGNEAAGPLPGDIPGTNVQVWVGSQQAQILYKGRSGCCAGLDQLRIATPQSVVGCYAPVFVVVDGLVSNFVTMSIAQSGNVCSDPAGNVLTPEQWQTVLASGVYRTGSVAMGRYITDSPTGTTRADSVTAGFYSLPTASINPGGVGVIPSKGACSVTQYPVNIGNVPQTTGLNAGTVSLSGPIGLYPMPTPAFSPVGIYNVAFIPTAPSSSGVVGGGTVLTTGIYTVAGTGGSGVGPFSVSIDFPGSFDWSNRASISVVTRSQPLTVTWTGGRAGAFAYIHGRSGVSAGVGADFYCWADAADGTFTIPAAVLSALPPSYVQNSRDTGVLDVYQFDLTGVPFTATGLDFAWATWTDGNLKGGIAYR